MIPFQSPDDPGAQAEHTLTDYRAGLSAAELRAKADGGPDVASRFSAGRLRNAALLWTLGVLVVGGVATWFWDQVMAAWAVAAFTAIVIVAFPARGRRTSS